MSADYDSVWKEALDIYFEPFLALLFPQVHRQINWACPYEPLDKEFQQIVPDAEVGRRYVDKLVKVWTSDGVERWVLIHVEVQTNRDADFPQRMYVYNYRIFDRYNRGVASLAVQADDDTEWRPSEYRSSLFGCETGFRFPTVKLLDLANPEVVLETSANPFAKIVLAHVKALQTRENPADRYDWKIRLVRGLYESGLIAKDVRELFRLIDWLMELPPALNNVFWQQVDQIQEEKQMPYVMSIERVQFCKGLYRGIESLLRVRFGEAGLQLMPEIRTLYDEDQLLTILTALETAASPEDVRRLWTASAS